MPRRNQKTYYHHGKRVNKHSQLQDWLALAEHYQDCARTWHMGVAYLDHIGSQRQAAKMAALAMKYADVVHLPVHPYNYVKGK